MLLIGMIKDAIANPNNVVGFDGVPFFSASHPVGLMGQAGTTAANINTTGSGPYWYLLDASRVIRPFIFQLRREYAVTRMNTVNDEAVFNRREFRYGVDGRANTGVGLWQLAFASNTDLSNPPNYAPPPSPLRALQTALAPPLTPLSPPHR